MYKILLALHLVFAIFAIGPLVHAASTASRGIRTGDSAATASSARLLRIYGIASVVVVALGIGLGSMSRPRPALSNDGILYGGGGSRRVADFGDTWIWLSLVLWAVSLLVVFVVLIPSLRRATEPVVDALTARVAAAGGVVVLSYVAIVFLMVYRPGG